MENLEDIQRGQNKANSSSCSSSYSSTLKGWRVLKIENNQIYLIHARTPECYYHKIDVDLQYVSIDNLNKRAVSQYLNPTYAESAHNMTYDEALAITGSLFDYTSNTLRNITGYYWLAKDQGNQLWYVNTNGVMSTNFNCAYGIRPVIVLKQGVRTSGKTIDAVGQVAWNLIAP